METTNGLDGEYPTWRHLIVQRQVHMANSDDCDIYTHHAAIKQCAEDSDDTTLTSYLFLVGYIS